MTGRREAGPATLAPRALNYSAGARWATVRIETDSNVYEGKLCIPQSKRRLSDVLCDQRPFLMVTDVRCGEDEPVEPFVAIHKNAVKTIRVVQESAENVLEYPVAQQA